MTPKQKARAIRLFMRGWYPCDIAYRGRVGKFVLESTVLTAVREYIKALKADIEDLKANEGNEKA
jgi:hypothetical protein